MDKDYADRTFQSLHEAKQDAMKEHYLNPPTAMRYIERLRAIFGPTDGEIDLDQTVF